MANPDPASPDQERQARLDHANPLRHQAKGVIGLILVLALVLGVMYAVSRLRRPSEVPSPYSAPAGSTSDPAPAMPLDDERLDDAESRTVEDSVYPEAGDPGVDALHYGLILAWEPSGKRLTGRATIAFRAASTADRFRLDLSEALEVTAVRLDGRTAAHSHSGKNLEVRGDVTENRRYRLEIEYAGTPEPVVAPGERDDAPTLGWHVTEANETWTMQEPFGAYTWYPVNDQPADKALYDFSLSVPEPMVGVANGVLENRVRDAGRTLTRWHLDEPASSYLVTVAFGDFTETTARSTRGVPISMWTPTGDPQALEDVRVLPELVDWAERKLGSYPFSSLGLVAVRSDSAMETQTMITLGDSDYIRSREVIAHELVHQWYGNQVTPSDWRDVWMNEGMTMYLQGVYEAESENLSMDAKLREWASSERADRRRSGPPGDYDRDRFGNLNIYYGPAFMWHEVRKRIGEKKFWAMVSEWPAAHDSGELSGTSDRDAYYAWLERTTGAELSALFDAWIMGKQTPPRRPVPK
ncbi:MAG: M1 family metallopeptidase [Nocardioides sp.]